MICRLVKISSSSDFSIIIDQLKERGNPKDSVEDNVRKIVEDVKINGDKALIEYTKLFDCEDFSANLLVNPEDIIRDAATVSIEDREIIIRAAENIRTFHLAQIEKSWIVTRPDGSIFGQNVTPVDRVGLYVPGGMGGETPLFSSLLMNAIPAQVAGVTEIAIVTPPRKDGTISPYILAVAHLLGIDEVYRVGSAWAIAALAYGTESIPSVDIIAGPGNIYVTTAKRLVQGRVGIDMIAGPSEILILADRLANPAWIAADMLSQAEHDPFASAFCITDSERLANDVIQALEKQCQTLPRAEIAKQSLNDWGGVIIVDNMQLGIDLCNKIAPEHLELCTVNPWSIFPLIRNAGAVFLGEYSPEAVGDYFAGPNHVLPTMGTARFSSALSVKTFCKQTSIIAASKQFTCENASAIARLSRLEGLEAHALSVECRKC